MHKFLFFTLFLICLFAGSSTTSAQVRLDNSSGAKPGNDAKATTFRWKFENERFTTPVQFIEFDASGRGSFMFRKKDSDEITNPLEISADLVAQLQFWLSELNFLDSADDYQHKKDFSHLGTHTITFSHNGRERTVKLNYTDIPAMNRLIDTFRNIAIQETRVFEIQAIRQSDPISTPNQMRYLESELKGKHIAEPRRLLPLLEEIKQDESLPLIARNHAERLVKMIQKAK